MSNKELPKAYEPKEYESKIYEKWEISGYFNPDNLPLAADAPAYSIIMPPPNVTGVLHLGHSTALTIQDILTRLYRMRGYRTLWVPGTDHAAIATQTKVEKLLKEREDKTRHDLGRSEFLHKVNEFAMDSQKTIISQTRAMGASCDWSRLAFTLDETRHRFVNSVFKLMYDDGLIYRGDRVVNWCPRCHSTLADDEVEYEEKVEKLYWIKYGPFVLATSRPETKLGDTAVAVNPDDPRYKDMVGKKYTIKGVLGDFEITVVADRCVDMEFGSGAVKVTPAHDFTDYGISQRHNLPIKKIIDEDGKMMENCGKYCGMTTKEAREAIVRDMEEMGLIDHIDDDYVHNISVCYRCGTQIEPIPSLQWFINVNKNIPKFGKTIKELSIEAVEKGIFGNEKIRIIPEKFEKTYFNWMNNLRDWCVSRQIWYGHRIPVWYKFNDDRSEDIYVGLEAPAGDGWMQDEDTLDTWFSSGLWTFSTLAKSPEEVRIENGRIVIDNEDFRHFHPTSVMETGYDILFFWVARMIIMTTYAVEAIPFRDVYLHGLVLDEKGKKMSKSKGNAIDPIDMIEKFGTDALRLSLVIGTTPGNDTRVWEEKIAGYRNFVNKLWNISRYILSSYDLRLSKWTLEDLTDADRWILDKLDSLTVEVNKGLDDYQFSRAGELLYDFTWNDLADWYLEVCKFEKNESKSLILSHVMDSLLKLWHPFIPFVTEAIWAEMSDTLLLIEKYPSGQSEQGSANDFELTKDIISAIRNARAENKVEPAKKIQAVIYAGNKKDTLESQAVLIKSLRTGIDDLEIKEAGEKLEKAIFTSVSGVEIYLLGAIDEGKEKDRLGKEIANLEKLIAGIEAKLGNEEFVGRAPAAVVEKEKSKLQQYQEDLKKFQEQLKNL